MLDNDEHWEAALAEAAQTGTAQRVRHLFALLLTTSGLSNPLDLWEKYKNALSDDILLQKRRENPDMSLIALEDLCLTMAGKDLKHGEQKKHFSLTFFLLKSGNKTRLHLQWLYLVLQPHSFKGLDSTFYMQATSKLGDAPVCDMSKDSGQAKSLQICSL
ncbi:ATP-dependent DNA helicase pif1 [Biomphalaria glabrata]|nr:ATP-dependent DNA helicase pif1 [Biomphalaria glabrata]